MTTQDDTDPFTDEWKNQDMHLFLLSRAGKPIYSKHGNENQLAGFIGAMQAIKFFIEDLDDAIDEFTSENRRIVFVELSPLIFVTIGNIKERSDYYKICIEYVYNQILVLFSKPQLEENFEKNPNLDLRNLLVDNVRRFNHMLRAIDLDIGPSTKTIQCLTLKHTFRCRMANSILSVVKESKDSCLLFLIIFYRSKLVICLNLKNRVIQVEEIHLIMNLIETSTAFKMTESNWLPICLPKYDPNGFLHANISYLADELTLTLISYSRDTFHQLQSIKKQLVDKNLRPWIEAFTLSRKIPAFEVPGLEKGVRHFCHIFNAKYHTSSSWTVPYEGDEKSQKRIISTYRELFYKLQDPRMSQVYLMLETEVFYAVKQGPEITLMSCEVYVDQLQLASLVDKLRFWTNLNRNRLSINCQTEF